MGLVATWLGGIGLEYAVPSFTAAGIVTPAALAELDVNHFVALGVKDPEDRRKLFFLVQRIKMAVDRKDESVEQEVDAVLASTMRNTSLILDEDDSLDELLEDNEQVAAAAPPSPVKRSTASNPSKENQKPKLSSSRRSQTANTPLLSQAREVPMRRHTEDAVAEQAQSPRINDDISMDAEFEQEDDESVDEVIAEDSDWDEQEENTGGDSADDELSSQHDTGRRRSSRRIQERRSRPSSETFTTAPSTSTTTTARRTTSLSRPTTGQQSSASTSPRCRSDSAMNRPPTHGKADTESSTSDNSSSNKPSARRLSGLSKPKGRRPVESRILNPSKSMRTGKQLSSIPAERIAPMSPLVELPASKLVADIEQQGRGASGAQARSLQRRRSSSLDRGSQSGSESDSQRGNRSGSNSDSETTRRRSNNAGLDNGIAGGIPRRKKLGRQSLASGRSSASDTSSLAAGDSIMPTVSTRQSTGSAASRSLTYSRSTSQSSSNNNKVTTQGMKEDDSFKAQIAQLRADNEDEHILFNSPESLADFEDEEDMRIRVVIRKRPMSRAEITAAGDVDVIHPLDYGSYGKILAYHPRTRVDLTKEIETVPFAFDNCFDETSTNVQIYERTVRGLIPSLFEGQWASIFAYGQTGSGKTFTMMGSNLTGIRDGSSRLDPSNLGLYYMAALDLFQAIKTPGYEDFTIGVSLFEIYGGKLFDLLNDRKHVKCLENSKGKVCFPGLSEHGLSNPEELISLIERGATNRSTGTTSRNADSSRSHAVLQLHLRTNAGNKEHSRLTFIDLAGSERGADTSNASRATRLEGAEINTSLLALKEVIRALATGDSLTHIPFRGSKLTQVLKESFIGKNCRSVMVACISPNIGNCEQTLNTLRYADRVKERSAETGESAMTNNHDSGTKRTSRISTLALPSFAESSEAGTSTKLERSSMDTSINSNSSTLLDDLLSSPQHVEASTRRISSDFPSSSRLAADELIAAHKSAMSTMLGMVKNEMTLVNQADADRENLDDYIADLNSIHEEQVSLLVNLREHVLRYRAANAGAVDLSDDSIEDLRD